MRRLGRGDQIQRSGAVRLLREDGERCLPHCQIVSQATRSLTDVCFCFCVCSELERHAVLQLRAGGGGAGGHGCLALPHHRTHLCELRSAFSTQNKPKLSFHNDKRKGDDLTGWRGTMTEVKATRMLAMAHCKSRACNCSGHVTPPRRLCPMLTESSPNGWLKTASVPHYLNTNISKVH